MKFASVDENTKLTARMQFLSCKVGHDETAIDSFLDIFRICSINYPHIKMCLFYIRKHFSSVSKKVPHIHTHTHIYIYIFAYMRAHFCICTIMHTHTFVYIYIHTRIYIYMYTYILSSRVGHWKLLLWMQRRQFFITTNKLPMWFVCNILEEKFLCKSKLY